MGQTRTGAGAKMVQNRSEYGINRFAVKDAASMGSDGFRLDLRLL